MPFINIWVTQATKTLFSSLLISKFDTKIQNELLVLIFRQSSSKHKPTICICYN